jgi:hypothetical protein
MNILPSLANGRFLPQRMTEVLAAANSVASPALPKVQQTTGASNDDKVSLSDAGIALARRANELGNATIDMAQSLVSTFAGQLFGDAAKGMKISFDSASISAMAGFSAVLEHTSGANGSTDAAALRVQEASDFTGKGQITTADGHVYNFSVEVHYQAMAAAQASNWSANQDAAPQLGRVHTENHIGHQHSSDYGGTEPATAPATAPQSTQQLNAGFPGTIKQLFNLLDDGKMNLFFQLPGHGNGEGAKAGRYGNLTLHLLDLLKAPAPASAADAKKLNDAYAKQTNAVMPLTTPAANSPESVPVSVEVVTPALTA